MRTEAEMAAKLAEMRFMADAEHLDPERRSLIRAFIRNIEDCIDLQAEAEAMHARGALPAHMFAFFGLEPSTLN